VVEGSSATWTVHDVIAGLRLRRLHVNQTARYCKGPVIDEIVARETPVGGVAGIVRTGWGRPRPGGQTVRSSNHVDYTVYGEWRERTSQTQGSVQVTGREIRAATGLYQYRATGGLLFRFFFDSSDGTTRLPDDL